MSLNRHDILIAFDVTNGNPNGNPDAGNMPRIEPNSGRGLVSDVCLKRKVRNFAGQFPPSVNGNGNQFNILVRQGAILNREIDDAEDRVVNASTTQSPADKERVAELKKAIKELKSRAKKEKDEAETIKAEIQQHEEEIERLSSALTDDQIAERAKNYLCQTFYDVRTFGGVLSTGKGVLSGSAHGQVRGPVQFTLGMSADPIPTQEITVTRCAVTKEEDAKKERTMGHKHIVPYGLYVAKAFVSPLFADKTGFNETDLKLFFDALAHLFATDQSAARAEMCVRAAFAFEHVGTQPAANNGQNRREQQLGCAHAHKLFASVGIRRKDGGATTFPTGFADYEITADGWGADGTNPKFPGVVLHRIVDPTS